MISKGEIFISDDSIDVSKIDINRRNEVNDASSRLSGCR